MGIGMGQIILVFLLVLLFFGAKRLPEIARAMGKAANEFHRAKNEVLNPPPNAAEPPPAVEAKANPASPKAEEKSGAGQA